LLNVDFKSVPTQCEECHEDPHGAQFAAAGAVTRCASCHNSMKWRPSMFDHEKTVFSLKGAHRNVRCEACHTNIRTVAGKAVLFYKPAPTACAACHGNGNAVGTGL
jgi:NAD-dependent SIR2 family protein deacetylase